jgi:hypothetical protein
MHPALHKRVQANPVARGAAVDVSFDDVAATGIPSFLSVAREELYMRSARLS